MINSKLIDWTFSTVKCTLDFTSDTNMKVIWFIWYIASEWRGFPRKPNSIFVWHFVCSYCFHAHTAHTVTTKKFALKKKGKERNCRDFNYMYLYRQRNYPEKKITVASPLVSNLNLLSVFKTFRHKTLVCVTYQHELISSWTRMSILFIALQRKIFQ